MFWFALSPLVYTRNKGSVRFALIPRLFRVFVDCHCFIQTSRKTDFFAGKQRHLSARTSLQSDLFLFVLMLYVLVSNSCNSYTMGCPPVHGDNQRALASGLSYVQVDKHGITILYHQHQSRPCTSQDISW